MTKRKNPLPAPRLPTWSPTRYLEDAETGKPKRERSLNPADYGPVSSITEEELLRGYAGLRNYREPEAPKEGNE